MRDVHQESIEYIGEVMNSPVAGGINEDGAGLAGGRAASRERSSWSSVDLSPIVGGGGDLEPAPTILPRSDGERLIYAAKVHSIIGEPESAKGWFAHRAAKDRLEAGDHVFYVDFEDEAAAAVDRQLALGTSEETILQRLHYVRPDEPLDQVARPELERALDAFSPTLAVIDGLTDALGLHGIDLRDNTEVANWMRDLPHGLRRRGIAVLVIDHVSKDADSRGRYAIGAQHKLAKVDVSYRLVVKEPLGRGLTGRVLIRVEKDRPGHVRRLARDKWVGEMIGESLPGGAMDLALEPPSELPGTFRPTGLMKRVSRAVEDSPGLSITGIRSAVPGRSEYVDGARARLVKEGFIEARKDGPAERHYPIRAFIEDDDGP
jgi:AAA domain